MTVTQWLQFIQENNDTEVARRLLDVLPDGTPPPSPFYTPNLIEISALLAAIRIDQMAKENRA